MSFISSFFNKNKEFVLYIICFLSHASFAPVFKHYGFDSLFLYNTIISLVYGIIIILYNPKLRSFIRNFTFFEILFYSIFITLVTGSDFGTRFFSICLIPTLFFFVYNSKTSLKYYVCLALIACGVTIFIIMWQFARPRAIYSGFMTIATMYQFLYSIHIIFATLATIIIITYLCIITEKTITKNDEDARRHAEQLNYMANHDALTELYNRRKIISLCEQLDSQKSKTGDDYTVCIFDIDNFKKVNDIYGHDAGDFILKTISKLVKSAITSETLFARWGGEEFLLVFPQSDNSVTTKLESIRLLVEQTQNIWQEQNIPITLTMGVSSSKSQQNFDKIIVEADNLLYFGKEHGKNQVCVCNILKKSQNQG